MHQEHRQLNHPTRLGIFVFYDPQGVVDRYVDYLLRDLSENLTDMVIVCNGALNVQGEEVLRRHTDHLYRRENTGFDAAAWKYAMTEALGWEYLEQYDEIVLLNDTFFGPVYPFSQMFEEMASRNVDFWGITGHGRVDSERLPKCPYSYLPAHIQSYFCVIRRAMHTAPAFREYWEAQPVYRTFSEVVGGNEVTFTQHFADLGFHWCTYVDSAALDTKVPCNQSILLPFDLLQNGCPVLKRKCFSTYEAFHNGNILNTQTDRALRFIKNKTDYPVAFIYETILRLYNIADIYNNLHLNFVLPSAPIDQAPEQDCRAVAVLQLNTGRAENKRSYLQAIPRWMDLIILTDTAEKAEELRHQLMSEFGSRLRVFNPPSTAAEFLFSADGPCASGQYEFLCFCPELDTQAHPERFYVEQEQVQWDNLLADEASILKIITCFRKNPHLGLLVPPWPFAETGNLMWADSFEVVQRLVGILQLNIPIAKSKPSLSAGMAFWCRIDALKALTKMDWIGRSSDHDGTRMTDLSEDAVGHLLPFAAQQAGYFTGWVFTQEYVSTVLCSLRETAATGSIRNTVKSAIQNRLSRKMWGRFKRIYHLFR